ncbi:hypothetical protein F4781DRAFT_430748 [Annulohypoxylon bovei var. microspora]|nr:hypothetical protein F4781DRAFT_430748 [Annulohypoxylon bovei var. microspora]
MLVLSLMLLAWFGLFALAQEKHVHISVVHKREAVSCEQAYGNGSQPCGGPESTYCFNPSSGQTCCAADNGFCDAGKYCAPVGGYCCFEGEDLATCARNAGFTLPASISNTTSTGANAIAEPKIVASPTLTVIPFLKETSVPASVDIQDCGSSEAIANSTTSVPTVVSHTNATTPTLVQISYAGKRANPTTGQMAMAGIIGILTMLF